MSFLLVGWLHPRRIEAFADGTTRRCCTIPHDSSAGVWAQFLCTLQRWRSSAAERHRRMGATSPGLACALGRARRRPTRGLLRRSKCRMKGGIASRAKPCRTDMASEHSAKTGGGIRASVRVRLRPVMSSALARGTRPPVQVAGWDAAVPGFSCRSRCCCRRRGRRAGDLGLQRRPDWRSSDRPGPARD